MKILILTDKMDIGGAETHIYTLICELYKRGECVTLISSGGVYAENLKDIGIRCLYAPLDKRNAGALQKSAKIIKKEFNRHDIIHAHTRFTAFLSKRIRGDKKYPPIVTTAHLNFPLFPFGPFAYWGDRTLAVSYDIKDYLCKNYKISDKKIIQTKNSIDTSLFAPSESRKKIIIHTSRIDKGRALTAFMLVEIAEKLIEEYPDFRILIVGSGNRYESLLKLAEKTNKKIGFPAVIIAGARSDIHKIIKYGYMFIGVSRSALEGMAAGLPTIICGDEGYGGIVNEFNFEMLAKTNFCARKLEKPIPDILLKDIKYLIKNKEFSEHIGSFSRKRIEEDYTPECMADDAIRCYQKTNSKPRILLVGFFGYNNLGDEETLNSAVDMLIAKGIRSISILSAKNFYKSKCGVKIKIYDRMNPSKIAEAVNSSDIVILCGGNLLQNETSTRSLIYYSRIIFYAKSKSRHIYMLSSGFGNITGALGNRILRKSIEACDFCGCRTEYDFNIANKYTDKAKIMPDLCFLMAERSFSEPKTHFSWILSKSSKIQPSEIKKIEKLRELKPMIIMLYKSEDSEKANIFKKHGIPFFTAHSFDKFAELLKNSAFTICDRLHGAIFSILCHTPAYITEDNCKKRAFSDEITSRCNNRKNIILPYNISAVADKKEIGVQDSDFEYVIKGLKSDIKDAAKDLFN